MEPSPNSQSTPRLPPAYLLSAQLLCLGHSVLAGSAQPEPRTVSLLPNPSLTLGAALEEFSAFHGHQFCMKYGIPQLCLSPRNFMQSFLGVFLGAISFGGMSITLSPAQLMGF